MTLVGYSGDTPIYKNDNCEQNKTDMKQELKNCAHCNGAAKVVPIIERHLGGSRAFYVECYECGARSRQHACENIAINAWNTRPDHSGESAEPSESQMRYELLKIILAKFDAEDFISTTKREYIDGRGWQNITRPPIAETQSMGIVNELINQRKQHSDD